jgi:hypothetical protein
MDPWFSRNRCRDTQYNDTEHNGTLHTNTDRKDTQHKSLNVALVVLNVMLNMLNIARSSVVFSFCHYSVHLKQTVKCRLNRLWSV